MPRFFQVIALKLTLAVSFFYKIPSFFLTIFNTLFFSSLRLTAKRVCEANQGTLVTIPDQGTQQLLRDRYGSTSKSKRVWIGATDRNREGAWEWVTGEVRQLER